jgi:sRNA-binding regulator protein Hfq
MSPIPEAKTGAPNIQDVFLNYARREKLPVTVHLLDGREF